jgi:high-affinity iron transporter
LNRASRAIPGEPRHVPDPAGATPVGDCPTGAVVAASTRTRRARSVTLWTLALAALGLIVWQAVRAGGSPDPLRAGASASAAVTDIAVLVFREGLECILVLAAITASMVGPTRVHRRPIAAGVVVGVVATAITWRIAVGIIDRLTESVSALHVQAATGLLAIVVLLIVMNWFFHKVYWSGWIALHTKRKRELTKQAAAQATTDAHDPTESSPGVNVRGRSSRTRIMWGFAALGFSSFYREGFEVVLFLQTYRLKLGAQPVFRGVLFGSLLAGLVAVLTFIAHRRLPYRKMLVLTGAMLGVVLLVMVGEQAQEMQLAHWLPTTPIHALEPIIPAWLGLWGAVFPTLETLAAQGLAAVLVLGSYTAVRLRIVLQNRRTA